MSEVLLAIASDLAGEAREAAMRKRRWEPVDGAEGWFRCPFEHGFLDELETLIRADLRTALGGSAYQAAFVHTAEPAQIVTAAAAPREVEEQRPSVRGPYRDAGASVPDKTLLADVMLGVSSARGLDLADVLAPRGWRRVEGTTALVHAFDLRMFDALHTRVHADLAFASRALGRSEVTGVWAMSTHRAVRLESEAPPPPRRALPWD